MSKIKKVAGAASLALGAAYLLNKRKKANAKKLGKPYDIQDANMVNEGALTSIQYYNEMQEKALEAGQANQD